MADVPDHELVGYGRPPLHTRYRKGQSGNPKGRPRGTKNLATDLVEELTERIPIREGDRQLRVSKQRALLKALMSKALKGDTRAAGLVLRLIATIMPPDTAAANNTSTEVDENDLAILERFIARRQRSSQEG